MILYGFAPERKKALENARFTGFSRASITFGFRKLHSHLFCNFLSEVFFFFLDTFSGLVTNKTFDGDLSAVGFGNFIHVFGYGLFAILCFYVYLIQQTDFFQLFVDTSVDDTLDYLLRFLGFLRIVLDLSHKNLFLMGNILFADLGTVGVLRS